MAPQLGLPASPLAAQPVLQPVGLPQHLGLQPPQPVVQVQVQAQPHVVVQAVPPQLGLGLGSAHRPLVQQDSFTSEQQRSLFRQISLGIQVRVYSGALSYLLLWGAEGCWAGERWLPWELA